MINENVIVKNTLLQAFSLILQLYDIIEVICAVPSTVQKRQLNNNIAYLSDQNRPIFTKLAITLYQTDFTTSMIKFP